jgi:DNA-binding Xre family transcriptional regulator
MTAAERGIWKSTELRRMLADHGLVISAGKMSGLWTGQPTSVRLDDLDVLCVVLDCQPGDLLKPEPEAVAARKPPPAKPAVSATGSTVNPRRGRNRTVPPA